MATMIDPFNREITYLRVSVTDRCDFRCHYCMAEDMTFLPKGDVLSLEELAEATGAFIRRGIRKVRLTGGEPLVRRGILELIKTLSGHLQSGALDELTMTTNGSQLAHYAPELKAMGMERINVSLDTLDGEKFRTITRHGELDQVMAGIAAAKKAGLKIKINTVAMKDFNENEISDLVRWCGNEGFDLTLIETMPLGEIGGDRCDQYVALSDVRQRLESEWSLTPTNYSTGGPSRYVDVGETGQKVGFITPLSEHFCETCNRMRLTCTGTLYMCLGQDSAVDFRKVLRENEAGSDTQKALDAAIDLAITLKPKGHDFVIAPGNGGPALLRHMNVTGG